MRGGGPVVGRALGPWEVGRGAFASLGGEEAAGGGAEAQVEADTGGRGADNDWGGLGVNSKSAAPLVGALETSVGGADSEG